MYDIILYVLLWFKDFFVFIWCNLIFLYIILFIFVYYIYVVCICHQTICQHGDVVKFSTMIDIDNCVCVFVCVPRFQRQCLFIFSYLSIFYLFVAFLLLVSDLNYWQSLLVDTHILTTTVAVLKARSCVQVLLIAEIWNHAPVCINDIKVTFANQFDLYQWLFLLHSAACGRIFWTFGCFWVEGHCNSHV